MELVSHNRKMKIYKKLIKPVVAYGGKMWILTIKEQEQDTVKVYKTVRPVYGPVKVDVESRIRNN